MENILITEKSKDYELLDSGEGEKLERYGEVILCRPDTQAIWPKNLGPEEWRKAHGVFSHGEKSGKWQIVDSSKYLASREGSWNISLQGLTFCLQLLPSKHLGVFPEQSAQWKWLEEKISSRIVKGDKVSVLNLFGYTGGASLACAKAGASVCHIDASQFAVDLAHKNLELSGLSHKPVRFIVDDVRKFVEREIKRGNKYDVILLDPPVYGKGIKKEVWKIEEDVMPLLLRIKNIISDNPLAIILNGYSSVYSNITYGNILESVTSGLNGKISDGELAIKESSSDRLLPCGIWARFEINN